LRAAYPGVSDQVIDGPVHGLHRVHHHDGHERRLSSHRLNPSYVFEDMYPGIMNFRFRGPGLPGDHDYKIRMVYFDHQEHIDFPHVGSIVAAVAAIPWDDNDPEEVERAHKAARTHQ
jgi:hypothetical protein